MEDMTQMLAMHMNSKDVSTEYALAMLIVLTIIFGIFIMHYTINQLRNRW